MSKTRESWARRTTSVLLAAALSATLAGQASAADKRTQPPALGTLTGKEAEAFYLGSNAIIWGYPAIFFEGLMRERTRPEILKKGNPQAAVNQFGLVRQLRGPEFKQIATPNNDTLYAQAFTDVSREPLVLSVPKVDAQRYYTFQLWDVNGDTFGYVGSRSTGREAGHYALVGPDWKGVLPANVKRIDSPYANFAIWGRIGVDGAADLKNALAIQDALRLTPLSQFGKMDKQVAADLKFSDARVAYTPPADLPKELALYDALAHALKFSPAKPGQDAVVADSLDEIGFKDNGTQFDWQSLNEEQRSGLAKGAQFALNLMDVNALLTVGQRVNGWRWSPKSGIMGTDYLFRAAFAKWYTGGNAPEEAIYMDGRVDDKGQPFSGKNKYVIHFAKGQQPPAKAFWSISMYHLADGSFVANPIDRYTFGDRTPGIVSNADGSLDVYLQHEAPNDPKQKANWLPAPEGGFYLNLRLYGPDDSLQKGTWAPPPVLKVNAGQ